MLVFAFLCFRVGGWSCSSFLVKTLRYPLPTDLRQGLGRDIESFCVRVYKYHIGISNLDKGSLRRPLVTIGDN